MTLNAITNILIEYVHLWTQKLIIIPSLCLSYKSTRLRAHDHYTSSNLIGGKDGAGSSLLPTTLERTNGAFECKVYMDSYKASNGSWFMGHLDYFQKPSHGGRPNTKLRDHGTLNVHNHCFILFYHVWGPAWIEIQWNSIWLRDRSHMTSHYTRRPMTTLHDFGDVLGRPLGSHNLMVTALGLGVKWP